MITEMVKHLIKNYVDLYELADKKGKEGSFTTTEVNTILSALLPLNELITREDEEVGYMMSTFNTYQKTVGWLKELLKRQELEDKAYEIIRLDMAYIEVSDTELREATKKASDETLTAYIEEATE